MPFGERVKPASIAFTDPEGGARFGSVERDFLRTDARSSLIEEYWAAGLRFTIATNYDPVLHIARSCLERPRISQRGHDQIQLRIWVDPLSFLT
jgi:hypothetical protein